DVQQVRQLLATHQLQLAAVGTGSGWMAHELRLTDPDRQSRRRARDFVAGMIDRAGTLGAPTIVGSMQGRWEWSVSREQALAWLGEALEELAPLAARHGMSLLVEPLNRYETNLLNRVDDSVSFLQTLRAQNVNLLCDLFHMNIEEASIAEALR